MKELLEIRQLDLRFKNFLALQDINLTIDDRPRVIGLIGPNGAGKTSLIKTILGQYKVTSGEIRHYTRKIDLCPDTPTFSDYITAYEAIEQARTLAGMIDPIDTTKLLTNVGLENTQKKYVEQFSRGMKQRLGIAVSWALKPDLLFLDEPTTALDAYGRKDVLNMITTIAQERVVVMSSHQLHDIQSIADELIVLNEGKLIYHGSLEDYLNKAESQTVIEASGSQERDDWYHYLLKKGIKVSQNVGDPRLLGVASQDVDKALDYLTEIKAEIKSIKKDYVDLYQAFYYSIDQIRTGGEKQ